MGDRAGVEVSFVREGLGSAVGMTRVVGPTGRDQTHTPQGEPTFRKGGGAKGREEGCRGP